MVKQGKASESSPRNKLVHRYGSNESQPFDEEGSFDLFVRHDRSQRHHPLLPSDPFQEAQAATVIQREVRRRLLKSNFSHSRRGGDGDDGDGGSSTTSNNSDGDDPVAWVLADFSGDSDAESAKIGDPETPRWSSDVSDPETPRWSSDESSEDEDNQLLDDGDGVSQDPEQPRKREPENNKEEGPRKNRMLLASLAAFAGMTALSSLPVDEDDIIAAVTIGKGSAASGGGGGGAAVAGGSGAGAQGATATANTAVMQQMAVGAANNAASSVAQGSTALSSLATNAGAAAGVAGGTTTATTGVAVASTVTAATVTAAAVTAAAVATGVTVDLGVQPVCPNTTHPETHLGLAAIDILGNRSFLWPEEAESLGATFQDKYNDIFGCESDYSRVTLDCFVPCFDIDNPGTNITDEAMGNSTVNMTQQCCNLVEVSGIGEALRCHFNCTVHCESCFAREPLFWANTTDDDNIEEHPPFNSSVLNNSRVDENVSFSFNKSTVQTKVSGVDGNQEAQNVDDVQDDLRENTACNPMCQLGRILERKICEEFYPLDGDCTVLRMMAFDTFNGEILDSFLLVDAPTAAPSRMPSHTPTHAPSIMPSSMPSLVPSLLPTYQPSSLPTMSPSGFPSQSPTLIASGSPSEFPSHLPTKRPSISPTQPPSLPLEAASCYLVNTRDDTIIRELDNAGGVIYLSRDGTALSIEVVPHDTRIGSVGLVLDGRVFTTENTSPYALGGNGGGGFRVVPELAQLGFHELMVTVYARANAQGEVLGTALCPFNVIK